MDFDALLLSRLQFALTISFHILFPTLTIGLAIYLAVIEGLWLKTKQQIYRQLYVFWSRIFALSFGMGVVSGVVLSYQFGTNFSRFSEVTGNVLGPLMTYEVMTAFFLEAGFLGIMLFGWNRVRPTVHYFATLMVAVGTVASAFWILAANSWMHTPAGAELRDGVFHVIDWSAVIFNPSFPYRFSHMILAGLITTAFFIAGVSAWYLYQRRHRVFAQRAFAIAIGAAALLTPIQILVGDLHGLNTKQHQPMKVAAMEGRWDTLAGAPLLLFAVPDQEAEQNRFELGIPKGASLILEHDPDGVVYGLKEVAPQDRPNVALVFYSFRVMIGIGLLMLALSWLGVWYLRRNRLAERRGYLRAMVCMVPAGFIATLAGWYVAEAGRQPWLVQGLLRTAEGVSSVPAGQVLGSLVAFGTLYAALFAAFVYYLVRTIARGPDAHAEGAPVKAPTRSALTASE
jgi:cytochrome d ubiquinol oxidase subunit I